MIDVLTYGKEIVPCPVCGKALVVRKNKQLGTYFVGCSSFPKCRFTVSIAEKPAVGQPKHNEESAQIHYLTRANAGRLEFPGRPTVEEHLLNEVRSTTFMGELEKMEERPFAVHGDYPCDDEGEPGCPW